MGKPSVVQWHLIFILGLSCYYESLFIYYGLNPIDEAWPIYAIWNIDAGGTLFRDVLWVFPPGHLIPAWLGYHFAPPGFVVARMIHAVFAIAACAALYFLGRRLMPPRFALLAALLIAVAAPDSHLMHNLSGYRYLIFSVLALLAYARRIETGDNRWLAVAGLWLGLGACFRLGPVFAAGCGLGVAVMTMHRDPRHWLRDWGALALGILVVFGPLLLFVTLTVGLDVVWRELVTRPATMLLLQSLPFPALEFPGSWDRIDIRKWFVALQFRIIWLLYIGYFVALVYYLREAWREGRAFTQPLLVAVWLWGGVFFVRSLTRSDESHLDSVIPPVLLLATHGLYSFAKRIEAVRSLAEQRRAWLERGVIAAAIALWVMLLGIDMYFPYERRGGEPIHALNDQVEVSQPHQAQLADLIIRRLKLTPPDARILDLTASPMYLLLANRRGYPAPDIVMPGTFLTPKEAKTFFLHVKQNPPELVIWPKQHFDHDPTKALDITVPELASWVHAHYERWGLVRRHFLMGPKGSKPPPGW